MDIEFYDESKHDYFLDEYRKYSREPREDEKEFFEPVLNNIVNQISEITGIHANFKLYFAMTTKKSLDEDSPINRYVHGFSFPEWMEGFDRDIIMIRAVRDQDNWKNCLINMLAHEMAHQEFYRKNNSAPYTNIENIIFEGHAMNRAEQIAKRLDLGWTPHYRSNKTPNINAEGVIQTLDINRTYKADNIFQNGEPPCPEAEGYHIAYLVVKKIIKDGEHSLTTLPEQELDKKKIKTVLKDLLN